MRNMATSLPTEDRPEEAPTATTQESQPAPQTNVAPAPAPASEPAPVLAQSQKAAADDDEDSEFDELDGNTYPPLFFTPPPLPRTAPG